MARYRGGPIAWEIKGVGPGAFVPRKPELVLAMATGPFRAPDPALHLTPTVVVRRLGPDHRKLDFGRVEKALKLKLVAAMASDIAALHAGAGQASAVLADLDARRPGWLGPLAIAEAQRNRAEWRIFKGAARNAA
jgi:hypothetical protein